MSDALEIANLNTLLDASMNALKIKDAEIEALSRRLMTAYEQRDGDLAVIKSLMDENTALKARVEELERMNKTINLIVEHLISVSADEEGEWVATVQRRWGSFRSATGATIDEAVLGAVKNAGVKLPGGAQ
jgi:ribosomal protein L11 methylase PrmA